MFGLSTTVTQGLSEAEFDNVTTILSHSSFKGTPSPWQSKIDTRGEVFYLDVEVEDADGDGEGEEECPDSPLLSGSHACRCSNSEDTGYSSDTEPQLSTHQDFQGKKGKKLSFLLKKRTHQRHSGHTHRCRVGLDRVGCDCAECSADMESVREAVLLVDPFVRRQASSVESKCERLLGIVPGHLSGRARDRDPQKVIIRGFISDGPAVKLKDLRIGDCLKAINGLEITWDNMDSILSAITVPKTVLLSVQHMPVVGTVYSPRRAGQDAGQLIQLLSPSSPTPQPSGKGDHSAGIFFTSMEGVKSEDMGDKEDLVYQFPASEGELLAVRGMFYTLSHMLQEVADTLVKSSTVELKGELVNVAYHEEGKDLMMVTVVQERLPLPLLKVLCEETVRLLRVLFGSLDAAFRRPEHRSQLDQLFSVLFHCLLEGRADNSSSASQQRALSPLQTTLAHSGLVQYLPLPKDVMHAVGSAVNEFEAADFADMSDSYYGCRRSYTILGSCLFYKGYLLCTHLPKADLLDIHLYLHRYGLLSLTATTAISQLVVWREIYPTRFCHELTDINSCFGYSEPPARWFLLVVGLKHSLFAVLLEAGGCAQQVEGPSCPDPFYIDQARAAMMQTQTAPITAACEARLLGEGLPAVVSADSFKVKSSGHGLLPFSESLSYMSGRSAEESLRGCLLPLSTASPQFSRREKLRGSFESDGSSNSGSTEALFKTHRKNRMYPVPSDSVMTRRSQDCVLEDEFRCYKFGSGAENYLFHYCHLEGAEGVLVTAPEGEETLGTTHSQLLHNFHQCCQQIRQLFHAAHSFKRLLEEGREDPLILPDESLLGAREHGVLFHFQPATPQDSKKQPPSLSYWVVGRKLHRPPKQEVFVCFHESTPQSLVDAAFKLGFSLLAPG